MNQSYLPVAAALAAMSFVWRLIRWITVAINAGGQGVEGCLCRSFASLRSLLQTIDEAVAASVAWLGCYSAQVADYNRSNSDNCEIFANDSWAAWSMVCCKVSLDVASAISVSPIWD